MIDAERAALEQLPLYLTIAEAADALGVSERTIWNLVERGELGIRHVGRAARIPRASLIAYVLRPAGEPVEILSIIPDENQTD